MCSTFLCYTECVKKRGCRRQILPAVPGRTVFFCRFMWYNHSINRLRDSAGGRPRTRTSGQTFLRSLCGENGRRRYHAISHRALQGGARPFELSHHGPRPRGAALSRRVSHGRRLCRDAVWLSGKNRPGPRHRPCAAGGLRPPPALPLLRRGDGRPPPSQHDGFDGTAQGGGVGPMARHERGRRNH